MLGSFLVINDEKIPNPNPGTWHMTYQALENVYTTEAGSQLSSVVRLNRLSWSGEFNCTSEMRDKLVSYAQTASVINKIKGVSHSGRLRIGGDISLVANSEYNNRTDGLWVVPLTFEEF